jgi:hypothetical protein
MQAVEGGDREKGRAGLGSPAAAADDDEAPAGSGGSMRCRDSRRCLLFPSQQLLSDVLLRRSSRAMVVALVSGDLGGGKGRVRAAERRRL